MQGEGQGIITTKDGEGMATWTGHGIGRFTASGKISLGLRVTLSEQKKKRVSEANPKYLRKIGENEQQYYTMAQES